MNWKIYNRFDEEISPEKQCINLKDLLEIIKHNEVFIKFTGAIEQTICDFDHSELCLYSERYLNLYTHLYTVEGLVGLLDEALEREQLQLENQ